MNPLSKLLTDHYTRTFAQHGESPRGVDWRDDITARARYHKMLVVTQKGIGTLLDVGCGYGELLSYAEESGKKIEYTGIDTVPTMIAAARRRHPAARFLCGDFLNEPLVDGQFDYVVCNGIFTQKLSASEEQMESFVKECVAKMFRLARIGVAFNLMTTRVNFRVENLYYKSPESMLAFCLDSLSTAVVIDHSYQLYEYTVYLYK